MRWRPSICRQCGRPDEQVGRISKRGLCSECGTANMVSNQIQLRNKTGPAYNLYAKRQSEAWAKYVAKIQAQLDEDARRAEQLNGT